MTRNTKHTPARAPKALNAGALALSVLACSAGLLAAPSAMAQEAFTGQIKTYAFNYCPTNTTKANGSELALRQNPILYSLLGTKFGGNGTTTVGIPDLEDRAMVAAGQGAGLTVRSLGQEFGASSVTLTPVNLPVAGWMDTAVIATLSAPNAVPGITLKPGPSNPISIMPPYVAMTQCVVTNGVFAQRP